MDNIKTDLQRSKFLALILCEVGKPCTPEELCSGCEIFPLTPAEVRQYCELSKGPLQLDKNGLVRVTRYFSTNLNKSFVRLLGEQNRHEGDGASNIKGLSLDKLGNKDQDSEVSNHGFRAGSSTALAVCKLIGNKEEQSITEMTPLVQVDRIIGSPLRGKGQIANGVGSKEEQSITELPPLVQVDCSIGSPLRGKGQTANGGKGIQDDAKPAKPLEIVLGPLLPAVGTRSPETGVPAPLVNDVDVQPKQKARGCKLVPRFEDFAIEGEVGSGGYGTVYKVQRNVDGRVFAIKCPLEKTHGSCVRNEINMLKRLRGKDCIIQIEKEVLGKVRPKPESGEEEILCLSIVLEFVEHDKPEILKKEITIDELKSYCSCLFKALAQLHRERILHLDVKPGNFLFSRSNKRGCLVDFNLARSRQLLEESTGPQFQTHTLKIKFCTCCKPAPGRAFGHNSYMFVVLSNLQDESAKPFKRQKMAFCSGSAEAKISEESKSLKRRLVQEDTARRTLVKPSPRSMKMLFQNRNALELREAQLATPLTKKMCISDGQSREILRSGLSPAIRLAYANCQRMTQLQSHSTLGALTASIRVTDSVNVEENCGDAHVVLQARPAKMQEALCSSGSQVGHPEISRPDTKRESDQRSHPSKPEAEPTEPSKVKEYLKRKIGRHRIMKLLNTNLDIMPMSRPSTPHAVQKKKLSVGKAKDKLARVEAPTAPQQIVQLSNATKVKATSKKRRPGNPVKDGPCVGTKGYRAPEVLMRSLRQTTQVDIWSAGVSLLQLVTGRSPFPSTNSEQALRDIAKLRGSDKILKLAASLGRPHRVSKEPFPPIPVKEWCDKQSKRPDLKGRVPSSLYDLIEKCLEVDPERRITAEEALRHQFCLAGTDAS